MVNVNQTNGKLPTTIPELSDSNWNWLMKYFAKLAVSKEDISVDFPMATCFDDPECVEDQVARHFLHQNWRANLSRVFETTQTSMDEPAYYAKPPTHLHWHRKRNRETGKERERQLTISTSLLLCRGQYTAQIAGQNSTKESNQRHLDKSQRSRLFWRSRYPETEGYLPPRISRSLLSDGASGSLSWS